MDIFEAEFAGTAKEKEHLPLAVRMRPANLDELAGQRHLLHTGSPLRRLVLANSDSRALPASVILYGPAGSGKTTIAYLIAKNSGRRFLELSAVTAGVKDVREIIDSSRRYLAEEGRETILFIDEIHRFSKTQQDALLPSVENRQVILVAATTENPSFSIIPPLLSRSLLLKLEPLEAEDIAHLLKRAISDKRGLGNAVKVSDEVIDGIIRLSRGDVRRALTLLEAGAGAVITSKKRTLTLKILEQVMDIAVPKYDKDGDGHYDVASAFIKSMRGSDVDAALHYLARMLVAGEDPRFIARRIMIAASEEVAMADPSALWTAVLAAQAVERIGMPESQLILAQAVAHICLAPKSNAITLAIGEAIADVKAGLGGEVPKHLRDAHYKGAQKLGHGTDYLYAHDFPNHIAKQQYLPDDLVAMNREYYTPTKHGKEAGYSEALAKIRALLSGNFG